MKIIDDEIEILLKFTKKNKYLSINGIIGYYIVLFVFNTLD